MRGWLKGSIAVLVAALVCALTASAASAAETPKEGGVFFELTPPKHARVVVEIHPHLGVAVVDTEIGPREVASRHRPLATVDYAARIPKTPIEGAIDLTIPGVLSIDGEVAPRPGGEGLEFNGSFRFTGKGGYLSFDVGHATGWSASGATAACLEVCRGPHPSLFDYINSPIGFFGSDTQVLYAERSHGTPATRFQATHAEGSRTSAFEAHVLEWLPGGVAVVRRIEVVGAPYADLEASSDVEHPESATVHPPAPFSGSAVYRSTGNIRSATAGKLTGSLAVDILGVKVPLAGPRAKASLINLNPGF